MFNYYMCGALTMWFMLGFFVFCIREYKIWNDSFLILIALPLYIIAFPIKVIIEVYKEIKSRLWFNWEHDWKWKWEEIKEKIKYRY